MPESVLLKRLCNGLKVAICEDHSLPLTAISVWYRAGARDDPPEKAGLAHCVEHVMCAQTAHSPRGYFAAVHDFGGVSNACTTPDVTGYWVVCLPNAFETAIWLEARRLRDQPTGEGFEIQRDVILRELDEAEKSASTNGHYQCVRTMLFGKNHPYGRSVIGERDSISRITFRELRNFQRQFYAAANASLSIVGDVDASRALSLCERWFDMPSGRSRPRVGRDMTPASIDHRRRRVGGPGPGLHVAWRSPGRFTAGDAAFSILAQLLGHGTRSRLRDRLVRRGRLVRDVTVKHRSFEHSGTFVVRVVPAPGRTYQQIEKAVHEEIASVAAGLVTDREMERCHRLARSAFWQAMCGVRERAERLSAYLTFENGPKTFEAELSRRLEVHRADLASVTERWLKAKDAVVLEVDSGV